MDQPYTDDQQFHAENFSSNALPLGEYENCTFTGCIFASGSLSGRSFSECDFIDCDLSNTAVSGTSFRDVCFKNCKLLGVRFDECSTFLLSFKFQDCLLNFSSFFKLKLKGTKFSNCKLEQVDFSEADFSRAGFQKCEFSGAIFSNTNLESADLETSSNFSIDPEINRIKKAKFSRENISGLLDKYQIIIK